MGIVVCVSLEWSLEMPSLYMVHNPQVSLCGSLCWPSSTCPMLTKVEFWAAADQHVFHAAASMAALAYACFSAKGCQQHEQ